MTKSERINKTIKKIIACKNIDEELFAKELEMLLKKLLRNSK